MKAIILAAGQSTRTHPLTLTRPKSLIKIANKTILQHNLDSLKGLVDEVILVVGYKKEMIEDAFGDSYEGIKLIYVEQKEQLGTGHAVECAKAQLDGRFILMNGDDIYSRKDIKNCLEPEFSALGKEVDDPEKWGIFVLDGDNLKEIIEKPKKAPSNLANTGLYVVDKSIFDITVKKSTRGEYEFTDMVTEFAKTNKVIVEKVIDYWIPVGYPWHILAANEFFVSRLEKNDIKGEVEAGVVIKGNIILGKGSILKSGTYIEGNVIIGENTDIGPNSYIRGNTAIGDKCKVGQAVEIKNSVLMDGSKVPHLSYVGDSVIGSDANLAAGTIIANLRHDNSNVKSEVNGELIDSGRRKFGAIIGDHVHTGIDTVIYPGRKIWPDKITVPGEIVKKDIK